MRFALLALLPALAAQGGKNEAEKLFRDLEKRVAPAKTVRVSLTATGTVWLDAQTLLPLKRELSAERNGLTNRIVETYSEFKLDAKAGGKPSR
jgi:hypothetical protein